MSDKRRALIRMAVGVVVGTVVGAIVAVNVIIFSGIDEGYQASIGDVFAESPLFGIVAVVALVGGPIGGLLIARFTGNRSGG